jgi:hypothetical protein
MPTPPTFVTGTVLTAAQMNTIGMHLVKTQTVGSGVSSVTVTGAFSGDYDNYLIQWSGGTQSVDTNLALQLGSATTNYYSSLIYGNFLGGAPANAAHNNSANWVYAGGGNSTVGKISCMVFDPFLARPSHLQAFVRYATVYGTMVGYQGDSTSFTSFTFIPNSGTMTGGIIRVYGYRNS